MRTSLAIALCLVTAVSAPAWAEKVKINQTAKLYARQGEQAPVIFKLKAGDKVTLLAKDGRWLKVRTNGRTGWIPRSKADVGDDDEGIQRNTRRRPFVDGRSKDRGSLGDTSPDDRVGGDATGDGGGKDADDDDKKPVKKGRDKDKDADDDDKPVKKGKGKDKDKDDDDDVKVSDDEPKRPTAHVGSKTTIYTDKDKSSDSAFVAKPDDVLFVNGKTSGKWTEVENSEGDLGYVLTSKLELSDDSGDATPAKRTLSARARGGVTFVQQGLRTAGSTATAPPDNYNIAVAAATLALGGTYLRPYNKDLVLGGDALLSLAKAIPGVRYTPQGGTSTTTGFSIYDLDLRFVVGYDLHKPNGMMILGRVGLRYDSFQVSDVGNLTKNPATLPSEIQISPAIGAGLALPKLTPKLGLLFALDAMFTASMKQTKGLEDGKSPSAKGACLSAGMNYKWMPNLDIQASYDLTYMSASFGAVDPNSMRNHQGTSVTRTDIDHMITVGVAKAF